MKKGLITSLVCLYCSLAFAQAPDTSWTKTFGGIASEWCWTNSVQQTLDSGYIIIGSTYSYGHGSLDIWLIKTDKNGDTLWTKTFGKNDMDYGNSIQQTIDSGYIIIGSVSYGGDYLDIWLIKTDTNGDTIWTKTFGDFYKLDIGRSVQQTSDSGYIIAGYSYSDTTNNDIWLIKTDYNGNLTWDRKFGASQVDQANKVQQTLDGGYIIIGESTSYDTTGSWDILLLKTDQQGNELWFKTFGGISTDIGSSVQQTSDSGYIIIGTTFTYAIGFDIWMIKTDKNGNEEWDKIIGGYFEDYGYSIQQTTDGGYIIAGSTYSSGAGQDVWLIKTDSNGNELWNTTLGGVSDDVGTSIQQTSDAGYILVGNTDSFGAGGRDLWLIKFEEDSPTYIDLEHSVITDFQLYPNYPNPFNPSTKISWQSPVGSWQTLKVYDLLGNEVATLIDEYKSAGRYEIEWDASKYPSGVYFYQLKADNYIETKKMILLK